MYSVGVSQPHPPPTLVLAHCAHEQYSIGGRARGFEWAQQHRRPLPKAGMHY